MLLPAAVLSLALFSGSAAQKRVAPTEPGDRLAWYQAHVAMKEASLFKIPEWRFIGPEIMSGRIIDIAVPSDEPHSFYIAAASGGVWKTMNAGTSWEPVLEHAPSTSVGAVSVSPSHPEIIWVGLGESNIFRSSMAGAGVFKSTDRGKTWVHRGLAGTHTIGRIVIHPNDPNIVYVAASGHEWTDNKERGVYKTTDGGASWVQALFVDEKTGAVDLRMDPGNPNVLYASMWNRIRKKWSDPKPGGGDGIFKTADGGKTWTPLTNGFPPPEFSGRMGIDIARTRPSVLYVLLDNHEIARQPGEGETDSYGRPAKAVKKGAELYRSDDAGLSFRKVSESENMMRLFSTYGWVFGQVRVDPNDENTVYVMGVPLMKSTDGGKTFESLDYPDLHVDHHALWIDPADSKHLINGNDGGVNLSYDGGKTWQNCLGPGVVQFYNVALDMDSPFNVYGSIQDNGCYKGPVTYDPLWSDKWEWVPVPGGEASMLAVDPSDPHILYNEGFYGSLNRSEWKEGRWDTKRITPVAAEGEPKLRGQWLAPFILSTHNPHILYHGMQYVFRSMDRGETWKRISPDLTYNDPEKQGDISFQTLTSISESPITFGLIYAGTDDGRVHVTRDGGNHWTEIVKGLPYGKWVSRILASAYQEGTVYLTLNGKRDDDLRDYIYRSTDYGKTWKDISGNIPCGPVNVIREDPRNSQLLYVGTDLGVYLSVNDGQSWETLPSQIPTTFVHDLAVHPRDAMLVAGTHGRGVYVMDVSILQQYSPEILAKTVHLFRIPNVKLPDERQRWRRAEPKAVFHFHAGSAGKGRLEVFDASNVSLLSADLEPVRGLNRFEWNLKLPAGEAGGEEKTLQKGSYSVKLSFLGEISEGNLVVE